MKLPFPVFNRTEIGSRSTVVTRALVTRAYPPAIQTFGGSVFGLSML